MNRHLIVLLLFLTAMLPLTSRGENFSEEKTKIELDGTIKSSGGLRSGGDALSACIFNKVISVIFHKYVGAVQVTITNGSGNVVYRGTVDSGAGSAQINLQGLPQGSYTLTFSNSGGTMWGNFQIGGNG